LGEELGKTWFSVYDYFVKKVENVFFSVNLDFFFIFEEKPTSKWVDFKTTHQLDGCTQNLHMCVH
jgi:hypothetical protein